MDEDLALKIGKAARQARTGLGLSQADVAERCGISAEFYARIERGRTLPAVGTLVKIADALAVSADVLLARASSAKRPVQAGEQLTADERRLVRRLRAATPRATQLLAALATELRRPASRRKA